MNPVILYNNLITDATITATSEAVNYDVEYLQDNKTFSYWKASASGTNNIIIDFGSDTFVGALGIASHNLKGSKLTLYKSSNGTDWSVVLAQWNVLKENAILKLISEYESEYLKYEDGEPIELEDGGYLEGEESESYLSRYWKLEIISDTAPQIGVLYLGEYFQFEYPPEIPVIPIRQGIVAVSERSNAGHLLGTDIRYYQNNANFLFRNITRGWYLSKLKMFWDDHAKLLKGFFFAWDLENRDSDIYYCKITSDSIMQEPLTMFAYVDEVTLNMEILA